MSKLKERMIKRCELPEALLQGVPRLTLTGNDSVLVEDHGILLQFTAKLVELGCGRLRLRISGDGLMLRAMDRDELLISGKICSVEVEGA